MRIEPLEPLNTLPVCLPSIVHPYLRLCASFKAHYPLDHSLPLPRIARSGRESGDFIDNYITNAFPASGDFSAGNGLPLFLSEYGANGQDACLFYHHDDSRCRAPEHQALRDRSQADYDAAEFKVGIELATSLPESKTGYFHGFSVFQSQDAFWKCPDTICTESQFGIQKRASLLTEGTVGGGKCGIPVNSFKYPVRGFADKPAWESTINAGAP